MSNQYKYKRITAIVKKLSSEKPRKMFIMFRACIAHQRNQLLTRFEPLTSLFRDWLKIQQMFSQIPNLLILFIPKFEPWGHPLVCFLFSL